MDKIKIDNLSRWEKVVRKLKRTVLRDEPGYYDMFEDQEELNYARQYMVEIEQVLLSQGFHSPLKVLDAGCQAGRLAIPLSLAGHAVIGVDTSGVALRRAKRHAQDSKCRLRLIRADLSRWLPKQSPGSFDVVVCTEVLYLRHNYRNILKGLIRLLRPGGACFISHRSTAYYLNEAFQKLDWKVARLILKAKEGLMWGSYYNWQNQQDLKTLYGELSVDILGITPIKFLSRSVINPETLDNEGRDLFSQAEAALNGKHQWDNRYFLISGQKQI
jgi:2-polyprenyl-3-methyl-5-hydroxy-6-metoxy-1,4-benzoquinol methylase